MVVLKKGMNGFRFEVKELQTLLNARVTPRPNLPITGHFGEQTYLAVLSFQNANGLKSDGIVGTKTWTTLYQGSPQAAHHSVRVAPSDIVIRGANKITPKAQRIVKELLQTAGLRSATISSVARDPYNQARVMYENLVGTAKGQGVEAQKKLYKAPGREVIAVYVANKTKDRATVIGLMKKKIEELGPSNVSHHAVSTQVETFDIAPSSIKDKAKFQNAIKAHPEIQKYFFPPQDPGYHIEISR